MYQEIDANKYKSAILMALFIGFVCAVGYAYGYYSDNGWFGLELALIVSLVSTVFTWFAGDKVVLSTSGAKRVESREESPELWNIVENLSITSGTQMPAVYVIEDESPNAFATGRDPAHASIAVTSGLLQMMNRSELEGVLAHELSHVRNYDTRWMMIVAVLVGSISLLADLAFRFGGMGRRKSRDNEGGPWLLVIGIVLLIVAPIIGQLIKFAISRQREYLADASAALLTRYPEGLASALEKIKASDLPVQLAPSATAHLWIASPFKSDGVAGFLGRIFSTHPPIDDRIAKLHSMGH